MKKLTVFQRKDLKKGATNTIRREGNVPAVLYSAGQANENIYVKGDELQAILRSMKSGLLSTTVFELHDGKKMHKALVKEVQYHKVSYAIEHIDFVLLNDQREVTLNVPIQVLGAADSPGIKLGGSVRQVRRSLKVSCLPKDIPTEFTLDVSSLNMTEAKRLSDIEIPSSVRALGQMNEVAVVIAKSKA